MMIQVSCLDIMSVFIIILYLGVEGTKVDYAVSAVPLTEFSFKSRISPGSFPFLISFLKDGF